MHEIAKYFGKNASTISRWISKAKKEKAIVEKETERALKEVARKNALRRFDRILAYEEMQEKTIERIMELLPYTKSIPVLTNLLEHIENVRCGTSKQENSTPMLNIVNQLNQISKMQESDYQEAKIIK